MQQKLRTVSIIAAIVCGLTALLAISWLTKTNQLPAAKFAKLFIYMLLSMPSLGCLLLAMYFQSILDLQRAKRSS